MITDDFGSDEDSDKMIFAATVGNNEYSRIKNFRINYPSLSERLIIHQQKLKVEYPSLKPINIIFLFSL